MKFKMNDLLDFLFCAFIFASILMFGTTIGKTIILLFVLATIGFCFIKERQFKFYHFLELLFVIYVFVQSFTSVAVLRDATSAMGKTMLYSFVFSLGFYNFLKYRNDTEKVVKMYVNSTIITFALLILLYFKTLTSFRLSAAEYISIFDIPLFGGNSPTSLAMMCVIPAFLLVIFSKENKNNSYVFRCINILFILSVLTGTRKTVLVFIAIYILFVLKNKDRKHLLYMFLLPILVLVSYFAIMNIPVLYNSLGSRIESALNYDEDDYIKDSSIVVRNRMRRQAFALYEQRPQYGWGMDYYKMSNRIGSNLYSHNNFLELLSGGGIVGFVIYYLKYIYLFIKLFKSNNNRTKYYLLIFLILMTILEYWQVTYFYRYIMIYQVFILYYVLNMGGVKKHAKKTIDV